jgi:hypothetical protein
MPIFINWFETEISAPLQRLFSRDFESWEESRKAHELSAVPSERFCRVQVREADKEIARTILFGAVEAVPEKFVEREVDLTRNWRIAERVIEYNLGQELIKRGMTVEFGSFGVSATKQAFRISDIGLCVESGISFKSYYLHNHHQHGITVNWKVKQYFDRPISALPESASNLLLGLPVILPRDVSELEKSVREYAGGYLGVITGVAKDKVEVLCRDATKRQVSTSALFLEAKPEVIAALSSVSKEQKGNDSVQRRVLILTHSLTQSGRRNIKILQDQLRSSIDFLNPDSRPFITLDFVPFCNGRMRISMAPATAQMQQEQYV